MRGSNPRLLAHKTNTLPTELMEPLQRAVLAEWLRRMLKAHVRKSVGSIPTDCIVFFVGPVLHTLGV